MSAGVFEARAVLDLARWAARSYAFYDRAAVDRIAREVAEVAAAHAAEYAERAVKETGAGVAADREARHLACSRGLLTDQPDLVSPRAEPQVGTLAIPRPAGIVLGLLPALDPVSTACRLVMLTLLTRNPLVLCPDPAGTGIGAVACRTLAAAATAAGAPDGVVQVVEAAPTIEALHQSWLGAEHGAGLLVLDGRDTPSAVPVLVDASADPAAAAAAIVASASDDNGIAGSAESLLIVCEAAADPLLAELRASGGHVLDPAETERLRAVLVPGGRFDPRLAGSDAVRIAAAAGVGTGPDTRMLLVPLDSGPEIADDPLAGALPCPVLGFVRAESAERARRIGAAVLRRVGPVPLAAVHTTAQAAVLACAAAWPVRRLVVNRGCRPDGTTDRAELNQLVSWTRVAHPPGPAVPSGPVTGHATGPVPPYPHASNLPADRTAERA